MRLIKLWDNSDQEILIDMDFKPEIILNRSKVFHKYIFILTMMISAVIIVSFS